jgi:hypothetical protein
LSPFHWSAACTIATSVAQLKLFAATELRSRFAVEGRRGLQLPRTSAMVAQSQQRTTLHSNHRQSSVEVFVGNPVPWPEGTFEQGQVIAWNVIAVLINFLCVSAYGHFAHKEKAN